MSPTRKISLTFPRQAGLPLRVLHFGGVHGIPFGDENRPNTNLKRQGAPLPMVARGHGLAARDSTALFQLAVEQKALDAVERDIATLRPHLTADLINALSSPIVPNDRKRALLNDISKELKLSDLTRRFLGLVAAKGRAGVLPELLDGVSLLSANARHELKAHVLSAQPLTAAQKDGIMAFVKQNYAEAKTVSIDEVLDPSLVAGVRIRVGSTEYDASLRGAFDHLHAVMKG